MIVAVIGARGQLGTDLCAVYTARGHRVTALGHDRVAVEDMDSCRAALAPVAPDLVINTAAMHQVERCEEDPAAAFAVNGIGPRNLALLANELDCALVHLSTDYVFDGAKGAPYVESDVPLPLNVYGNTKLSGEVFVRTLARRGLVVRVSGLFGTSPCRAKGGLNFVELMRKLARERDEVRVVDDEVLSPTCTRDVAENLEALTGTGRHGLYHMVSGGACSWHAFAAAIFELTGADVKLSVAGPGEFPAKVPRPAFSALENRALREAGLDRMPHWKEGLARYLRESG